MEQFINTKLIIMVIVVGNAVFVLTSILYRGLKGKSHLAIPEFDIKFSEKWVSSFVPQGKPAKLGKTMNCLAVELSRKALVIRTMFPFNLSFLPQVYDLDHFIPKNEIKCIQPEGTDEEGRVIIEFESAGVEKRIELSLKKRQEFLRAVGESFGRQPVPSGIFT